jgi:methylenetetrahydrofolate dehydrogenase (NADP+)/methenyltetrahydrofolate cyclohydrolase
LADLIDGRSMARALSQRTAEKVQALKERGVEPTLAVALVGNNPASEVYVGRKVAECRKVGIRSIEHRSAADCGEATLLNLIDALNADADVHGILVQLPLPKGMHSAKGLKRILPVKDVDGFHPVNVGRLSTGTGGLVPCTPLGIMMLLDTVIEDYRGLNVVVIGKSNIVGKPVAMLLRRSPFERPKLTRSFKRFFCVGPGGSLPTMSRQRSGSDLSDCPRRRCRS